MDYSKYMSELINTPAPILAEQAYTLKKKWQIDSICRFAYHILFVIYTSLNILP